MSERENVAKGLEELMMHGGDVTHRDRKNLLGKAVALLRAVPEELPTGLKGLITSMGTDHIVRGSPGPLYNAGWAGACQYWSAKLLAEYDMNKEQG